MTAPELTDLSDPSRGVRILVPRVLPGGTRVDLDRDVDGSVHSLRAWSDDRSTVYVEVVSGPGLVEHMTVVAEQASGLAARSDDVVIGAATTTEVAGRLATTFDVEGTFDGTRRVRRFVIVDGPEHTFRIVIDPTSEANRAALASATFAGVP